MPVRVRTGGLRPAASFAVSACFHGGVLGWVVLGPGGIAPERPRSLYDQEIRSGEKKIVWYNLHEKLPEKLPEVAPVDAPASPKPPRARVKLDQTRVSGARDDDRPSPMIFLPDPDVSTAPALPKPAALPNVVAVAPAPKPVRLFVPPPTEPPHEAPAPVA